jgi:hypothetical protein
MFADLGHFSKKGIQVIVVSIRFSFPCVLFMIQSVIRHVFFFR